MQNQTYVLMSLKPLLSVFETESEFTEYLRKTKNPNIFEYLQKGGKPRSNYS